LEQSYQDAWASLLDLGLADLKNTQDKLNIQAILGALALAKGLKALGALITTIEVSELQEYLDKNRGWSE
jgi:hypothetical protein